eukprot:TRINITY_DN4994_c0_g1_i11.p4 TRINITY_DN4994_c0_g1~~TRINITY_DN4994_c0_g1_i11.p4  ORF type:complete len:135 (-),score=1.81 TRINITY_DN4994_c0_g1_i11:210-614(-)
MHCDGFCVKDLVSKTILKTKTFNTILKRAFQRAQELSIWLSNKKVIDDLIVVHVYNTTSAEKSEKSRIFRQNLQNRSLSECRKQVKSHFTDQDRPSRFFRLENRKSRKLKSRFLAISGVSQILYKFYLLESFQV